MFGQTKAQRLQRRLDAIRGQQAALATQVHNAIEGVRSTIEELAQEKVALDRLLKEVEG